MNAWAKAARYVVQNGAEGGTVSECIEAHDADVLIPLALLEIATDDDHCSALEARVDDMRHFEDYVYMMVSAVRDSADAPDEPSLTLCFDDIDQAPVSPRQRNKIRDKLNTSLNMEELEELGLGSSWKKVETPSAAKRRTDVRKDYLNLAKHYHPDKGGDKEMFITLQEAYEVLVR